MIRKSTDQRIQESISHLDWLFVNGAPQDFLECEKTIIEALQKLNDKNEEIMSR